MAKRFMENGFHVVSGGTDNHLVLGSIAKCPPGGKVPMLGVIGGGGGGGGNGKRGGEKSLTPICREESSGNVRVDLTPVVGVVLRKRVLSPWTLKFQY